MNLRWMTTAALLLAFLCFASAAEGADPAWRAGVASMVITPEDPMWMAGYAARDKPSGLRGPLALPVPGGGHDRRMHWQSQCDTAA